MIQRALPIMLILTALAVMVTIYGGVRHDYGDYLKQWALVLEGADPWSTNNAYGPLHNAFAWLVPIGELAPKLFTATALLLVNGLLLLIVSWISGLIGFGLNVDGFWWGVLGALVLGIISWLIGILLRPIIGKPKSR